MGSDEVRVHAALHRAEAILERQFPERLPFQEIVSVRVVHENIETTHLGRYAVEQSPDLFRQGVVDLHRNTFTAVFRHHASGIDDGLWTLLIWQVSGDAPASAI